MKFIFIVLFQLFIVLPLWSQSVPPSSDGRLYDIVNAVSAERIEKDIRTLVDFGTRNTLSDTVSSTRGIGAARRWIKKEFQNISSECASCLTVVEQRTLVTGNEKSRIKVDTCWNCPRANINWHCVPPWARRLSARAGRRP